MKKVKINLARDTTVARSKGLNATTIVAMMMPVDMETVFRHES